MNAGPHRALLPDGRRLHLQHGPIDLVVEAFGPAAEVRAAYAQAAAIFEGVLPRLVAELAELRRPLGAAYPTLEGPVARRMAAAVWPHRARYITPMAAVAGSVADEVLESLVAGRDLQRAYVNNGGDIALHLTDGARFEAGVVTRLDAPAIDAVATIHADTSIRGIATSGRNGRSLSLGIADAVTVLARTAAAADAAATLIANAVDMDHPAIMRQPACDLDPDSDLGDLPVTTRVGDLDTGSVAAALDAGAGAAEDMRRAGLIEACALALSGRTRVIGTTLRRPALAA